MKIDQDTAFEDLLKGRQAGSLFESVLRADKARNKRNRSALPLLNKPTYPRLEQPSLGAPLRDRRALLPRVHSTAILQKWTVGDPALLRLDEVPGSEINEVFFRARLAGMTFLSSSSSSTAASAAEALEKAVAVFQALNLKADSVKTSRSAIFMGQTFARCRSHLGLSHIFPDLHPWSNSQKWPLVPKREANTRGRLQQRSGS
jgi:hypothetical protein